MTYAQLKKHIEGFTQEQLAMKVMWCGEGRGGEVEGVLILKEDMCNPSGDGWEPKSEVIKQQIDDGETEEAAKAFAESEIVWNVGDVFLMVDSGDPDMLPNES